MRTLRNMIDWSEGDKISGVFLGRSIVRAHNGVLELDNGTLVRVEPNEGCGGCGAGWYEIESLAAVENVITNVTTRDAVIYADDDGYPCEDGRRYEIFVVAADEETRIVSVVGDDGNGYYGTGYSLIVTIPGDEGASDGSK